MRRYHITVGAKTTVDGTVRTGWQGSSINGQFMAREGDDVYCPECDSTGKIVLDGARLNDSMEGRQAALEGDLCSCKCDPPPKLIANQTIRSQWIEGGAAPRARPAAQPAAAQSTPPPPATPRPSGYAPAQQAASSSFSELPGLACQDLWRGYQKRAEAIVAPGGVLIADPKARNRAINAAYARLWLKDQRFQWAGLAAFASKQVGCGLLHAADSIEKIQAEHEAGQRMIDSAERKWKLPGLTYFGKTGKQAQHDYKQARQNNPVPSIDLRRDGEPLSYVQERIRHVHDMLAMGNTTLFLDVYPLHLFYKERGLEALETCLESRQAIYESAQAPVLWPIEIKKLQFGTNREEILLAFKAIDTGNVAKSVEYLAWHEQKNILQPVMYNDWRLDWSLYVNHLVHVSGFLPGVTQGIELTLVNQCRPVDDGRTIGFGNNPLADLSDIHQRMPFVLNAAAQFDALLRDANRHKISQAIQDIAAGRAVR